MLPKTFRCYLVTKDAEGNVSGGIVERPLDELPKDRVVVRLVCSIGKVSGGIVERPLDELPEGDVLVRVAYSSLNYKDALAAMGPPGVVTKTFPHVPGVDAAGTVARSRVDEFAEGDPVLATGFDLGASRWGGLAEYVSVPKDWIVPLPEGLTLRESMMLGTAGLTAAMGVHALEQHGVTPRSGRVVVTGATGGVGSIAIALLAKLGYEVAAVTGKRWMHEYLKDLGAAEILGREEVRDRSDKPLLARRWAGAIDTVGGDILSTIVRATTHGGCVACCGLTAGTELSLTVFPFILRGVFLCGVDAAWCPLAVKRQTWDRLAGPWKLDCLDRIARFIGLDEAPSRLARMLGGGSTGRLVVRISPEAGGGREG